MIGFGREAAYQGQKLGWKIVFCVYICLGIEKFLIIKHPVSPYDMFSRVAPRMQSIFLIWAELKGKACGPDPRFTTLKS